MISGMDSQPEDSFHIETTEKQVEKRNDVGKEGRITCSVYDGVDLIAEFSGATAYQRAEECVKLARAQKARGVPIKPVGKCVADGLRLKKDDIKGPMLPWGGIPSRQ